MRFLCLFAASALAAAPAMLALALWLAPAPIAAEYWVREMIVVKHWIAHRSADGPRVLLVAGSSGLFGIDSRQLTETFGVPFINFALHAAMPLEALLREAAEASKRGDTIILALEPHYYCPGGPDAWSARNMIAWRPERWRALPLAERVRALRQLGPSIVPELAAARLLRALLPALVQARLDALDDATILRRFETAPEPTQFAYSAFHLDGLGNMRAIAGPPGPYVHKTGIAADARISLCDQPRDMLQTFVRQQSGAGVAVYFAHSPYFASPDLDGARVAAAGSILQRQLETLGPVLDTRGEATFEQRYFFDSGLHLNSEGRVRRTKALEAAIRRRAAFFVPPSSEGSDLES